MHSCFKGIRIWTETESPPLQQRLYANGAVLNECDTTLQESWINEQIFVVISILFVFTWEFVLLGRTECGSLLNMFSITFVFHVTLYKLIPLLSYAGNVSAMTADSYTLVEGTSVVLACPGRVEQHNNWYYGKEALFYNRIPVKDLNKTQFEVYVNHSLLIKYVSLDTEGEYTCVRGSNASVKYLLSVQGW